MLYNSKAEGVLCGIIGTDPMMFVTDVNFHESSAGFPVSARHLCAELVLCQPHDSG